MIPKTERNEAVAAAIAAGESRAEVADRFGIGVSRVAQLVSGVRGRRARRVIAYAEARGARPEYAVVWDLLDDAPDRLARWASVAEAVAELGADDRRIVAAGERCSVCGGPAAICWLVDRGCIVVATEHQHLCLQHAVTCEPVGPLGADYGPCVDGERWLGDRP